MDEIFQLKITLEQTAPPIWRRILVKKNSTFLQLHYIIQIVMGWENYHLFEFRMNDMRIGEPNEEEEEFNDLMFGTSNLLDAAAVTLDSIITETKQKINYEYDFGDGWRHKIVVEKFLPRDKQSPYPICIGGKLNCPPEDCGGIPGYYHLLEILEDKRHPEYKEMVEWLGEVYEPEYFNKEEVNQELKDFERSD